MLSDCADTWVHNRLIHNVLDHTTLKSATLGCATLFVTEIFYRFHSIAMAVGNSACRVSTLSLLTWLIFVGAWSSQIEAAGICADALQGKVAWDYKGSKSWGQSNVDRLCGGAENSREPADCFQRVMHGGVHWGGGTQWEWRNAVDLCKGTRNAELTIDCFSKKIGNGQSWRHAIATCGDYSRLDPALQPRLRLEPVRNPALQRRIKEGSARLRKARSAVPELIKLTQDFVRYERFKAVRRLTRLEAAAVRLVEAAGRVESPAAGDAPLVSATEVIASAPVFATREALLAKIAEVLELLPRDDMLAIDTDLRLPTATSGHLLTGLLSAFGPLVGTASYCEESVILHVWRTPEGRNVGGPSALNEYFETVANAENPGQLQNVVVQLTRIQEALYCFSVPDLSALDAAYFAAMETLVGRMKSSGRSHMARILWDTSLPVTLLVFDTLKRFQRPLTLDLLRLPADLSFPGPRTSGDPTLAPFGGSLASQLYCQGDRRLTLNRLGVWLPNIVDGGRLGAPLGSMGGGLCRFLELGTDPMRLGEGDCPLSEMLLGGMFCASEKTCSPPDAATGEGPHDFSLSGSRGGVPLPGTPRSDRTVFGVARSNVPRDHCADSGSPGGAVPIQCAGPRLSGAGRFSKDPWVDRQLRCGMRYAGTVGRYSTSIKLPGARCLVTQEGGTDPLEGADPSDSASDADPGEGVGDETHARERILEMQLAAKMRAIANDPAAWARVTHSASMTFTTFDPARFRQQWLAVARGLHEGTTHSIVLETTDSMRARGRAGECCRTGPNGVQIISIDPDTSADEMPSVLTHEGGHAALEAAESVGAIDGPDDLLALPTETAEREAACRAGDIESCGAHHAFMRGADLFQCGTGSVDCNLGCNGLSAYFERIERCVAGDSPSPLDPYCRLAEDACGDPRARDYRSTMALGRGCLNPVPLSSLTSCAHVLCGAAAAMGALSACCAGGRLRDGHLGGVQPIDDVVCRYAPDLCASPRF